MDNETRRRQAPPLIDWLALSERLCREPSDAVETPVAFAIARDRETEDRHACELRRYRRTIALTADLN